MRRQQKGGEKCDMSTNTKIISTGLFEIKDKNSFYIAGKYAPQVQHGWMATCFGTENYKSAE